MSAPVADMTAEEFRRLEYDVRFTQLIDGVVVVNQPNVQHGFVQARLVGALFVWADARQGRGMVLTPIDVTLTDRDTYGPDVVWLAEEHSPTDLRQTLERVPDLVAEIRSPSTWRYDTGRKRDVYEAGGLPELWLVDPYEEVVTISRRSMPDAPCFDVELRFGVGETLSSPLLPGFELPVERLFRR